MVSTSIREEGVVLAYWLVEDAPCTGYAAPSAAAGFAKQMREIIGCELEKLDWSLSVYIDVSTKWIFTFFSSCNGLRVNELAVET